MPGSLPALGDALTYQPPPSTSYADYSVAPTFVPASSSADPAAPDGSTTSATNNASLATQVYAASTSPSTTGSTTTPYDDPALTGDPTFSTSTDPSAGQSAADAMPATAPGQKGAAAATAAASSALADAFAANQKVANAADSSAPFVSPNGTAPLFQQTSAGNATRGVDANGLGFTTVAGEPVQLTVASATAADGSWFYTQSYVDALDVATTPDASRGQARHDTVSAGYVYSAHGSAAGGFASLTAFQNFDETGSLTQTVTAGGMTSTGAWTWQQHQHATDTVWNSANVSAGTTAAGESGSVSASASLTGIGTYFRPFNDGTANGISGSVFQTSSQSASTGYSMTASQDSSGAVTQVGSVDDSAGGLSLLTYGGSGAYTVSADDGAGTTSGGGGTATESGAQGSSYGASDHFTLGNDGSWQAGSGAGWTMAGGFSQQGYSGHGSYASPLTGGGAMNGTWTGDANADTNYNAQTQSALNGDGSWATTGTAGNGDDGYQDSSYSGSGSTGVNPASAPGITGGGTVNASAGDHSNYVDSEHYTLDANGNWNASSGSGSAGAHGNTHSDYSGSGGYSYALTGGGTMAGAWNQSGHDNTNYQAHAASTLQSDGVTWNLYFPRFPHSSDALRNLRTGLSGKARAA